MLITVLAFMFIASPPPLPASGPIALRIDIRGSREHACSRSFASTTDVASIALDVNADGGATMTFDARADETYGPSPSRYMGGEHGFTRTTRARHVVWTGRATRRSEELIVTFESAVAAERTWSGEGSLPLPTGTRVPAAWTLACRVAERAVLPAMDPPSAYATPADTQAAAPLALVRCVPSVLPEPLALLLMPFTQDEVLLAPGRGVVLATEARWGQKVSVLRHVAP